MIIDSNLLLQILISGGTALAANSIANGPANSLVDIWNGVIGHQIHAWSEKRKTIMNEKYIPLIVEKVSQIPEENLQEPKMSVLGPALEASKFYIEEEEIREMFANLIASSMDKTYNDSIQHSFVEIIKQLSPYDAKLFNSIDVVAQSYDLKRNNTVFRRKFYVNPDFLDFEKNAISLTNLNRLGLLDTALYFELSTPDKDFVKNHPLLDNSKKDKDFSMQPHLYLVSPLGEAFKKVCIKDSL